MRCRIFLCFLGATQTLQNFLVSPKKPITLVTLEVCVLENIKGVYMCAGVQIRVFERSRIGLGHARACMTHAHLQTTCVACVERRCGNLNERASIPRKSPSVTVEILVERG